MTLGELKEAIEDLISELGEDTAAMIAYRLNDHSRTMVAYSLSDGSYDGNSIRCEKCTVMKTPYSQAYGGYGAYSVLNFESEEDAPPVMNCCNKRHWEDEPCPEEDDEKPEGSIDAALLFLDKPW